jgi:predicted AlkP superfamily phosphohydrolase/phosphomutase
MERAISNEEVQMSKNGKLVLIGLDGGTFAVLRPLVDAGIMPNLARFLSEGASGTLLSTHPPVTCPAWPTMFTGVNPGKHSIFSFTCRNADRAKPHTASLLEVRTPTLWEFIGGAGYRVGVMNVPITFPAQPVNGFMVSGFPAPGSCPQVVWPCEEYEKLVSDIPEFTVNWPALSQRARTELQKASLIKSANAWLQTRIKAFEYFLNRHEIDFCFLVFEYTDKAQHWFYPLLDSTNDASATQEVSKLSNLIRAGYKDIDSALGRLVERFGENSNYIIVSDHGFAPVARIVYLNHLLALHGLFTGRHIKALTAKVADWARLPLWLRAKMKIAQDEPWHRLDTWRSPLTNFTKTHAFAGHQYEHSVYLNVEGQCPDGIVKQGREYESVRGKVIDLLRQAKDPKTGKHIFEDVWAREEIYAGEHMPSAPDVIFELAPGYVVSAGIGLSTVLEAGFLRDARDSDLSGYHRPDGIFVGYGPAFRHTQNVRANLLDIVPTVLALMGIAPPVGIDGRIIAEAIHPKLLTTRLKQLEDAAPVRQHSSGSVYSSDDETEIARQLADLGYL